MCFCKSSAHKAAGGKDACWVTVFERRYYVTSLLLRDVASEGVVLLSSVFSCSFASMVISSYLPQHFYTSSQIIYLFLCLCLCYLFMDNVAPRDSIWLFN